MIKIDKSVPIPERVGKKYPFDKLEVGDSIFIEGVKIPHVANSHKRVALKNGWKFISRTVEGGVRVWRVA